VRIDLLAAILIFLVTIVLVIWQPYRLGLGWNVRLGAVLALLSGVVHLSNILVVWQIVWNATELLQFGGTYIRPPYRKRRCDAGAQQTPI
jgi:Na+/H+ antiporter NhaD/arsenite permease-like protein